MKPTLLVFDAQVFAHAAHDSIRQKRKYTGEPYWHHTDEVALLVASVLGDPEVIAAAHLHDVLEDVAPDHGFTYGKILSLFGDRVAKMVVDLTDQYVPANYPTWNRAKRKAKEAERLGMISPPAMTIKLADLISNSRSIRQHDPKFAKTYLAEKAYLLPFLLEGDPALFRQAEDLL